ncbi:MAG: NAD(P)-dependent oxidoreductase, partial [Eubacterium sp.]|nr:NAD(P)-dependent oxidoreductase [Eubacterium sp.]
MARFPLFIDISSLNCLVFGGGKVACRKIETLLKYDARIQVVS